MPTKLELAEQVARLETLLKEKDELLMKAAIKLEELMASRDSLAEAKVSLAQVREESRRKRLCRNHLS